MHVLNKGILPAGERQGLVMDVWLIFTQETGYECDPVYPLLMGDRDLARGYLLFTRQGGKTAIVGVLDAAIPPPSPGLTWFSAASRNI